MKPRVKLCGITSLEDALLCTESGADCLGFIFYSKSPRSVTPDRAAEIIRRLPAGVQTAGVFVNEERGRILRVLEATRVQILQLSGDESPQECQGYPVPVWKSFRIRERLRAQDVQRYPIAAAVLDGAKGSSYGGSGLLADFEVARLVKRYHTLVLAGGLTPENILEAVREVQPHWVDVASGVESRPGVKDNAKVSMLFRQLATLTT